MVNSPEKMETSETNEPQSDDLPPIESLTVNITSQESKEADHATDHTVYRHLDFSTVPKNRDNISSVVFHAPAAGTPAALALEGNPFLCCSGLL